MKKKVIVFFFYLIISILLIGVPLDFRFSNLININPDTAFFLWCFKWWIYSFIEGQNPIFTKAFWTPYGTNLAWTTSIPSLSFLMFPITYIWGPIASFHFVNILSLSLSGFFIYMVLKALNLKEDVAIFGGTLFILSPYIWGHLLGHLNLSTVFLIPIALYISILRLKFKLTKKNYISLLTIILILQFGISKEIFAIFIVLSAVSLLTAYLIFKFDKKIINLSYEIFISLIITFIVISPFLYLMFTFKKVEGFINDPSFYSADLISFLIPTEINFLLGKFFINITHKFTGNVAEQTAFLGPLLITPFFLLRRINKFNMLLVILFFILVILSLGPFLHVNGNTVSQITLPWYIFIKLPLIKHALPVRISLFTFLVAVVITAYVVNSINSMKKRLLIYSLLTIMFMPNLNYYLGKTIFIPDFIENGNFKKYIKKGENVIIFPLYGNWGSIAPIWQYKTNFYFNTAQLFAGTPPKELIQDKKLKPFTMYNYPGNEPKNRQELIKLKQSFLWYILKTNTSLIMLPYNYHNKNVNFLLKSLNTSPLILNNTKIYKVTPNYIEQLLNNNGDENGE